MNFTIQNENVSIYDPKTNQVTEQKLITKLDIRTILFFYPADFSVVCPTELETLNKLYDQFNKLSTKILVISRDSHYTHKNRIESEEKLQNFQIEMVSDIDGDMDKLFDFPLIDETTKRYKRTTAILDSKGKVCYFEMNPSTIGRHIDEYVQKIKALTYIKNNQGILCPEGREEDEKGIKDTIEHGIPKSTFIKKNN